MTIFQIDIETSVIGTVSNEDDPILKKDPKEASGSNSITSLSKDRVTGRYNREKPVELVTWNYSRLQVEKKCPTIADDG